MKHNQSKQNSNIFFDDDCHSIISIDSFDDLYALFITNCYIFILKNSVNHICCNDEISI
jgi:hypothetical protein